MSYNGWTNYETWLINIWFYDYHAEDAKDQELEFEDAYDAGQWLKEQVWNILDETNVELQGFVGDVVGHALSVADWTQLGKHIIEYLESDD